MKGSRAILYIRVSTDEQAEKGHSLAHQDEMLRRHCQYHNIEIIAVFKEDYSAKTFNRPEFKKLLEFVRKNRSVADKLLFLKWDRFSRNVTESYIMISKLEKLGIEPQAIEQPLDMEIPEQKLLLALYLTSPEVDNDRRSLNTFAGMRKAMKDGRHMGPAPCGYKNSRGPDNKPYIIPGEHAGLILEAFETMATGLYCSEDVRRIMNKKGMSLGRSRFGFILRNPVYIGKIYVPAYKKEPAELKDGIHEALISPALFYEVQHILDGRKRHKPKKQFCQKEELPLRGFLNCAKCGRPLTGSASKGRSARYHYYHCRTGCKERFKAEDVNRTFSHILQHISDNDKTFRSLQLILGTAYNKNKSSRSEELKHLKAELSIYQNRKEKAQNLMLDGDLSFADFQSIKSKIDPEIELFSEKIRAIENLKNRDEEEVIEFGFYFLSNLDKLFMAADLEMKRHIIGSTFPEKLIFENNVFRTASTENILLLIANSGKGFREKKRKQIRKI